MERVIWRMPLPVRQGLTLLMLYAFSAMLILEGMQNTRSTILKVSMVLWALAWVSFFSCCIMLRRREDLLYHSGGIITIVFFLAAIGSTIPLPYLSLG